MKLTSTPPAVDPLLLTRVDLFDGISNGDLNRIAQQAIPQRMAREEIFFHQGAPSERVYLLLEGHVKLVQLHHGGQQIMLRVALPVEMFGAIALGQIDAYPATAAAMDDCRSVYWTRSDLTRLLLQIPKLAENSLHFMASHLQLMQNRYRLLATERVEQRLAHNLIELASSGGVAVTEGLWLGVALSQQELAEMCGTTLYTVSRLLKQWQNQNIVRVKREHIVVINMAALEEIRGLSH